MNEEIINIAKKKAKESDSTVYIHEQEDLTVAGHNSILDGKRYDLKVTSQGVVML